MPKQTQIRLLDTPKSENMLLTESIRKKRDKTRLHNPKQTYYVE